MAPFKDIVVPELGMTTEEVTIEAWLKGIGEPVRRGEPLVDLVTDKASLQLEATDDGVLAETAAEPGATVPVGTVVGRLDLGTESDGGPPIGPTPSPAVTTQMPAEPVSPAGRPVAARAGDRVRATPIARRKARAHGLSLAAIAGSGPNGRIRRGDVEVALAATRTAAPPPPVPTAPPPSAAGPQPAPRRTDGGRRQGRRVALSSAQRRLAAHLTASTVPQFGVARDIDLTAILAVPREPGSPSVSDVLVKAVAMTLRHHEQLNASYEGDHLLVWDDVNVGIAVAVGSDLHAPVIRGADRLRLIEISAERKALTARARAGALRPADTADATFVISNMGPLGVAHVHAVVSPPQVCVLGVGAPIDRAVPTSGGIVTRRLASFRATCDHRAVNGATAAAFLADLAARLANPFSLGEA